MLNYKSKNQSGITLVALVITVIILMILAGVALSLITDGNGLLGRVNQTKDAYYKSSVNEVDRLDTLMEEFEKYEEQRFVRLGTITSNGNLYFYGIDSSNNFYYTDSCNEEVPDMVGFGTVIVQTNTKLQLTNKVNNIKVKDIVGEYLIDTDGKLYKFSEDTTQYQPLFNGKEFQDKCYLGVTQEENEFYLCILGKDKKIYLVENGYDSEINTPLYNGTEFKDINNMWALSEDNNCYGLYEPSYQAPISSFSSINNLGDIIYYRYDICIDSNGDAYYKNNNNFQKMNDDVKIKSIIDGEKEYPIVESENGDLYYIRTLLYPFNKKSDEIEFIYPLGRMGTIIYKDGTTSLSSFNTWLNTNNLKALRYNSSMFISDSNDLYINASGSYNKINTDIKFKEIWYGDIILGLDNKLYKYNRESEMINDLLDGVEIKDYSVEFYQSGNGSTQYTNMVAITNEGEICFIIYYSAYLV